MRWEEKKTNYNIDVSHTQPTDFWILYPRFIRFENWVHRILCFTLWFIHKHIINTVYNSRNMYANAKANCVYNSNFVVFFFFSCQHHCSREWARERVEIFSSVDRQRRVNVNCLLNCSLKVYHTSKVSYYSTFNFFSLLDGICSLKLIIPVAWSLNNFDTY